MQISNLSLANSKSNLSLATKSNLSLTSSKSLQSIQSYNGSIKASPNDSSFYPDADCNITELTVTNSGLDLDLYFNGKTSPAETTESDSGISDQFQKLTKNDPDMSLQLILQAMRMKQCFKFIEWRMVPWSLDLHLPDPVLQQ